MQLQNLIKMKINLKDIPLYFSYDGWISVCPKCGCDETCIDPENDFKFTCCDCGEPMEIEPELRKIYTERIVGTKKYL